MPIHRIFVLLVAVQSVLAVDVAATDIFVYAGPNGSRLITDHVRMDPGYRLIRTYRDTTGAADDFSAPRRASHKPQASEFDGLIQQVSRRIKLDAALIKSVIQAESAFNPQAVSKKGARGLMQLMPATARRYGATSSFNPQQNVLAGSRYLKDLLHQFNGDMRLALAGYNAGENAVIKYGGIPPYTETRDYVRKVLGLYKGYRNLQCTDAPSGVKVLSCTDSTRDAASAWVSTVQ